MQLKQEILDLFARFGTGDYQPTEGEKQFVSDGLDYILDPLIDALTESVKLQSHYAKLLNMYDGGKRMQFENVEAWLKRMEEVDDRSRTVR